MSSVECNATEQEISFLDEIMFSNRRCDKKSSR